MTDARYILSLSCPDRPGVVSRVSALLYGLECNIIEAQQYSDLETGRFFLRNVFDADRDKIDLTGLKAAFAPIAAEDRMTWALRDRADKRRAMLLVSRFDHCLADVIYRWRIGEFNMDLSGIIANYPRETYPHIDFGDIPFFHLPVRKETKMEQEAEIWRLIQETRSEVVVLARYMQILSDGLAAKLSGRCINIHHSFLPGFKGAKPYHQAHARGVKLIGATAHYVTADLDEGPIIEQDVERISHADRPEDLVRKGRDIERRVLARALSWHLDDRVILNGSRTVVFRD